MPLNKYFLHYIKNFRGKDYISMEYILKQDFNICFVITARNLGKSRGTMTYVLKDCIENNNEFLYIRNTEIELRSSNVITTFYNYLDYVESEIDFNYEVKPNGVYHLHSHKKLGSFLYFSRSKNSKSQGELNNVKWIIYEEFINPDFVCKSCINRFADIFKTYQRNNVIKTVFLGNKDDLLENDFLIEFGIDFDLNNKDNQIIWNEDKKILAILINYPLRKKDVLESQKQYENIFTNTTAEDYTKGLSFKTIKTKNIFSWNYHKIADNFKALYKLRWADNYCCVGIWNSDKLYVKELVDLEDFKDVVEFTVDINNTNSHNNFLEDYDILDIIYFHMKKDALFYSSMYIRDQFHVILCRIEYVYRNQKIKNEGGL